MALRVFYEAGLQATSEDITDRVRLYTPDVKQNAEEGSVAMSSLVIDDPLGDYDIKGWRRIRIYEDAATGSNTLIYNGWVADRKVERGPYLVGSGRQWNVSLADMNTVLGLRVLHNPDANRPAETDIARLNWLLGTLGSPGIPVTEYLNTTGPIAMDAVDYRGQTRFDVVNDCSQASGKNFFVYTKDAAMMGGSLQLGLWYDFAGSTEYASVIRLSNVVSDLDEWTFAIGDDTYLVRDPSRSYSGVYLQYDGGSVYEESITTSNEFTRRDAVVPAANVKTSGKATARALRYLGEMESEDDRITASYYVPAAKVNFLREGMRCQFKATHMPGYSLFSWMRVMNRTVKEVTELEEDPEPKYLVTVELSTDGPAAEACSCDEDLAIVQHSDISFAIDPLQYASPASACLLISARQNRGTPAIEPNPPDSFANADWIGNLAIAYRVVQPGDGASFAIEAGGDYAVAGIEVSGATTVLDMATNESQASTSPMVTAAVTPPAGARVLLVGAFTKDGSGSAGGNTLPVMSIDAPATHLDLTGTKFSQDQSPTMVWGYRFIESASGSYTMSATSETAGFANGPWGSVLVAFGCE